MKKSFNRYIRAVGIELEGAWPSRVVGKKWRMKHDGSVSINTHLRVGEVVSKPLSTIKGIRYFISEAYPKVANSSCGLHVHISLTNMYYHSLVMSQNFYDKFFNHFVNFASNSKCFREQREKASVYENDHTLFLNRLQGRNNYCKKRFEEERCIGLFDDGGRLDRYNAINYGAWSKFKTVEFRVFPMFTNHEIAITVVEELIDFVTSYFKNKKPHDWYTVEF